MSFRLQCVHFLWRSRKKNLKGKQTSEKSINFFLKFENLKFEASNIMYFLPEYVSNRKYSHLKFNYSWHHRHISTLQLIVYCVDYVTKHSILHHWALLLHFQKVICEAGNKGILIFLLILISSPYFLALEKKALFPFKFLMLITSVRVKIQLNL